MLQPVSGKIWVGSAGVPAMLWGMIVHACYYKLLTPHEQGGGTVLAQCGGPTTTQIANNPSPDGSGKVTEVS